MLIYEKSVPGRRAVTLSERDVPEHLFDASLLRKDPPFLPEVAEIDLVRHYTELSRKAMGVDNCFYPLGSCTMKYNPKLNEVVARNPSFAGVHPLQPEGTVQGTLEVMYKCSEYLADITGMDAMCLQPAAGAQGEYSSLQTIRKYHLSRGDTGRTKVIVPDSAHGTNPASAAMCGFDVINVKSDKRGNVDLRELRKVLGPDTAALMLTNPNTLGLLDENILKITSAVHRAGGLVYYDGANLNAVMGIMRPGDLGFDVVHLNLHKTFSSPHGGGGPGSGPIGCRKKLEKFLPGPRVAKKRGRYVLTDAGPESIGRVKAFYGNIAVVIRAYAYILTLGADGIRESAELSVLNANYLKKKLEPCFRTRFDRPCMHEFVLSLEEFHKKTGVSAADVAKALIDYGIHPPTIYFPLIVHEALMFEPTETESRETLDRCAEVMREIYERALKDPEDVKACPKTTAIGRPDEVLAARHPVLRYSKE